VRRFLLWTAAVLAAVFFFLLLTLPPAPARYPLDGVDADLSGRTAAGAYHVHTTRSDGAGSKGDVAAAASRAGLKFVVLTDHGDGTRPLDPPEYLNGVLCIDGVEISTNGGHYAALAMSPSPYPLGGEPSAVVEDVRRLGGFGAAAHPDHPVKELSWTDWNAPFDALEWINADAEWRDEGPARLGRVLFDYLLRPAPAIASVFDRPIVTIERWDTLQKRRPVVALAAVDAHGGARARMEKAPSVGIGPSYEASFRSLSNRVVLERPLAGDAVADARLIIEAIRAGRVYSVVDAVSPDVVLRLAADGFEVASALPGDASPLVLSRGNRRRVEIRSQRAPGTPPVQWVVSNWSGPADPAVVDTVPLLPETVPLPIVSEWRVEKDPGSSGRVSASGGIAALEYKLRSDARASQFVAAVAEVRLQTPITQLLFRGRGTKPMRVSVQLRFSPDGARWTKSVYLEPEERVITLDLRTLVSADRTSGVMPPLGAVQSVLFVVDLVNSRPGDSGAFAISELRTAQ
jgi:hypothetical protein